MMGKIGLDVFVRRIKEGSVTTRRQFLQAGALLSLAPVTAMAIPADALHPALPPVEHFYS
jgi:hypothetical protein